jgi:hypothetical protein
MPRNLNRLALGLMLEFAKLALKLHGGRLSHSFPVCISRTVRIVLERKAWRSAGMEVERGSTWTAQVVLGAITIYAPDAAEHNG